MTIGSENTADFYQILKSELPTAREQFVKSYTIAEDESELRSLTDAEAVLDFLEINQLKLIDFFHQNPSLLSLFNKDFGSFDEFCNREIILELCFLDDFIFPEGQKFSLSSSTSDDTQLLKTLLDEYTESFTLWMKQALEQHSSNQDYIKQLDDSKVHKKTFSCSCQKCLADYRAKIRDLYYKEIINLIDEAKIKLGEELDTKIPEEISKELFYLQKAIDKNLHYIRNKLKRSTLNKLEKQIKAYFKSQFSYQSELAKRYIEKLTPILHSFLEENSISREIISESELERFYKQLGTNLWKEQRYLLREFDKLVKSVLRLKTQDVSSKILQEYLGQFWLHSEARQIKRKVIYHMGPTNSGKTYHALERLCQAETGCYLAPLRLLAGELYDTMTERGIQTTLLTGEEVIEAEDATHFSSTIEMAKLHETFECCVIDEIQMISDPQRGWAWTRAFVSMKAQEVHICGDGTVLDLVKDIVEKTGDDFEIKQYKRLTALEVMPTPVKLGELTPGDALIVFSRRNALKYKADLEKLGLKVSIIYGRLGPEVRREQARKFDQGETDIMVSTDAIAMGMNLPIKRIIFSTLSKYIDDKEIFISNSEIKQIAGRAGRYKRFPIGHVSCLSRVDDGIGLIQEALETPLEQNPLAMVGPDLDIYKRVNNALNEHTLPTLQLSEFLRLFNTIDFVSPFYCVDLKEMIELTEIVETANEKIQSLSVEETFGFACAPVNMGLTEHIQYYIFILNNYIRSHPIRNEEINPLSDNIDYLETSIKCVELFQWLSRHFGGKNFDFKENELLHNKSLAIEQLNKLLSAKIIPNCSSCGVKLPADSNYRICESCFAKRRFTRSGNYGGRRSKKRDNSRDDGPNKKGKKKTRNRSPKKNKFYGKSN